MVGYAPFTLELQFMHLDKIPVIRPGAHPPKTPRISNNQFRTLLATSSKSQPTPHRSFSIFGLGSVLWTFLYFRQKWLFLAKSIKITSKTDLRPEYAKSLLIKIRNLCIDDKGDDKGLEFS